MPQRRNAIKALRTNRRQQMQNLDIKTDLKKTIKKFKTALESKSQEAQSVLKLLHKKIDKAAKKNVLHKNTAARRKSVFSRQLALTKKS